MTALSPAQSLPARHGRGGNSRALLLVRVLLGFESAAFSVITPLLPHYQQQFGVSKAAIGILVAAYPAGMIPGSLLGGWIAVHGGVRRAAAVGLLLLAASAVAFGFSANIVLIDGLRFMQGVACGCIWGGGLAWVIATTPRERRGAALGSVFAWAIVGSLLGPLLGALAVAAGTKVLFPSIALVSFALAAWTLQHPEPPKTTLGDATSLRLVVANRRIILGVWTVLLSASVFGATGTLLPLRLSQFGASGVAIGVTFAITALLSAVVTPTIGRAIDRRGITVPLGIGLGASALFLALLPLPKSAFMLAVVTVIALGAPLVAVVITAMSLVADVVERIGAAVALGTMCLNLAWATGELIGAPVGAGLARATSDAVPFVLLSGAMFLTFGVLLMAHPIRPHLSHS